jgi:hypothetical protein
MGHIDPNRLGIVSAVMLTAWHGVWMVLVAAGAAQRVADFVLRMHAMKSEVVVEPFDAGMATLLLVGTALVGYVGGASSAALWNCLGAVCHREKVSGGVGLSARA